MPTRQCRAMDTSCTPTTDGFAISLETAGEGWSWRLTTPTGAEVGGLAPDRSAARRSAAFAACVVGALGRTQRRRF